MQTTATHKILTIIMVLALTLSLCPTALQMTASAAPANFNLSIVINEDVGYMDIGPSDWVSGSEGFTYTVNMPSDTTWPQDFMLEYDVASLGYSVTGDDGGAWPQESDAYWGPTMWIRVGPEAAYTIHIKKSATETVDYTLKFNVQPKTVNDTPIIKYMIANVDGREIPIVENKFGFTPFSLFPLKTVELLLQLDQDNSTPLSALKNATIDYVLESYDGTGLTLTDEDGNVIKPGDKPFSSFYRDYYTFYVGTPNQLNENRTRYNLTIAGGYDDRDVRPVYRPSFYVYAENPDLPGIPLRQTAGSKTFNDENQINNYVDISLRESAYSVDVPYFLEIDDRVSTAIQKVEYNGTDVTSSTFKVIPNLKNYIDLTITYIDNVVKTYHVRVIPHELSSNNGLSISSILKSDGSYLQYWEASFEDNTVDESINIGGIKTRYLTFIVDDIDDLTNLRPRFSVANSATTVTVNGVPQVSGVTSNNFTNPVLYLVTAETGDKMYYHVTLKKVTSGGPQLFIHGPAERRVEFGYEVGDWEWTQYQHEVLVANLGNQPLNHIKATLNNAKAVALDPYWTIDDKDLLGFVSVDDPDRDYGYVPGKSNISNWEMWNLAKAQIKVRPGTPAGTYTDTLTVTADGVAAQSVQFTFVVRENIPLDINTNIAAYSGGSSNNNNGSYSGSDSGSSKRDGVTGTTSTSNATSDVNQSQATDAAKAAAAAAKKSGATVATVRIKNCANITLDALKAMAKAAGMPVTFRADFISEDGKAVEVRITLDPAKSTKGLNLTGSTTNARAKTITAFFEKWFTNKVRGIHLEQQGSFGQPVEIAAKIDLTGLDTGKLYFYNYDKKTNQYTRIDKPAYWIDKDGYIHFTTESAGEIIISQGALVKK